MKWSTYNTWKQRAKSKWKKSSFAQKCGMEIILIVKFSRNWSWKAKRKENRYIMLWLINPLRSWTVTYVVPNRPRLTWISRRSLECLWWLLQRRPSVPWGSSGSGSGPGSCRAGRSRPPSWWRSTSSWSTWSLRWKAMKSEKLLKFSTFFRFLSNGDHCENKSHDS